MTPGSPTAPALIELDEIEARFLPEPYVFPAGERAAIDAYYARRLAANPQLWNGRILLLAEHRFEGRRLVSRYAESDYASLLWLLAQETAHRQVRACFAMGALRGADGGFVLIRMAGWTANAGRIYFAAGTPDLTDVTADGRVDLEGNLLRELAEETGIAAADVALAPCWTAICDGRRVALMRQMFAREDAAAVAARIRRFVAGEHRSEIDEVIVVRGPQDVEAAIPPLVRLYLADVWGKATMEP